MASQECPTWSSNVYQWPPGYPYPPPRADGRCRLVRLWNPNAVISPLIDQPPNWPQGWSWPPPLLTALSGTTAATQSNQTQLSGQDIIQPSDTTNTVALITFVVGVLILLGLLVTLILCSFKRYQKRLSQEQDGLSFNIEMAYQGRHTRDARNADKDTLGSRAMLWMEVPTLSYEVVEADF